MLKRGLSMKQRRRLWAGLLTLGLLLGIHEGYIAIWRDGEADPLQVFPYRAELLPEQEQRMLAEGIYIRDERHLHSLLDEYLS